MPKLFPAFFILLISAIQISARSTAGGAPTVTINQATETISQPPGPQPDPTTILPIEFTVVFSEPVQGFDASDISLAGSTADVSRAAKVISRQGSTYQVVVSLIATKGQIKASIPAGAVTDADGNPNTASTSTDNIVTYNPNFVAVAGRITDAVNGRGFNNAILKLYLVNGEIRYGRTNAFGYYRFERVQTANFSMSIERKRRGLSVAWFLWQETLDLDFEIGR